MKEWVMKRDVKIELTGMAETYSAAYAAVRRLKHRKETVTPEERTRRERAEAAAMSDLKSHVSSLSVAEATELAGWIQYRTFNEPIEPLGQGRIGWNKPKANALIGALLSLGNAIKAVRGSRDKRTVQVMNRAVTTMNVIKGCHETGFILRDGLTVSSRDALLRAVDKAMHAAKATNKERALELSDLYTRIEKFTTYLKPRQQAPQVNNFTMNSTKPIATMGQALAPMEESATEAGGEEVATIVAKEQSKENKLRDKAFGNKKPKGSGKPPFASARPGGKKAK